MSRTRLILAGAGLAVLAGAVALPAMLAGPIERAARRAANSRLDAAVHWREAGLSLFGDFPHLSLRLDDASVVGTAPFAGDTLLAVDRLALSVNLLSALRAGLGGTAPIEIRTVTLDAPRLRLRRLADGRANWRILRDTTTAAAEPSALQVRLQRLAVTDAALRVDDDSAQTSVRIVGYDQTLAGDFGAAQADLETRATADSVTVALGGIRYLPGVRLALDANIAADFEKQVYTLRPGTGLGVNALRLDASGTVTATTADVAFQAPATDIKGLLSLVPALVRQDFADVQTSGTLQLNGFVKGRIDGGAIPAFGFDATIAGGALRYPRLALPLQQLALDLGVRNPGGSLDATDVDLRRLHVVLGGQPIDASLRLRTPISDPDVDARVQGRVNLADLRRSVPLPDVQELAGSVAADLAVRTRRSWLDAGAWERMDVRGTVDVEGVALQTAAIPKPIRVQRATLALTPQTAALRDLRGTIGASDLQAEGTLGNLLGYLFREGTLTGRAAVRSTRLVLDDWRSGERATGVIPVPPRLDLQFDGRADSVVYGALALQQAQGRLRVKDERLSLEDVRFGAMGGAITMAGSYETTTPDRPTIDFTLALTDIRIPESFRQLATVRALAPMAKYMQGAVSASLRLAGPLGPDLVPDFRRLTAQGTLATQQVAITDFPPFAKAAAATKLALLNNPTLRDIRSSFEIRDGRFRLSPFDVGIGGARMTVAGTTGLDQALDATLRLAVPRALLGGAGAALDQFTAQAKAKGLDLASASEVQVGITLRGTIVDPTVGTDVGGTASRAVTDVADAAKTAATTKALAAVDSAKLKADAAAAKALAAAEQQAAKIREDAKLLADRLVAETNARADSLVAQSGGGLKKLAAEQAAKRLRKEGADRAAQVVREADAKAEALVAAARPRTP